VLLLLYLGIGRSQCLFIEAHDGRDEAAIGERCPDGRQEVGSEQRLNDIAEPARIECCLGEVGVFVDCEDRPEVFWRRSASRPFVLWASWPTARPYW
jgi:hypothetical protein